MIEENLNVRNLKNRLNDLDGKEWIKCTKSVWIDHPTAPDRQDLRSLESAMEHGVLLSESPPRDELKKNHPATFSENDIAKLIRFFTKSGDLVLDPFLGSGSSAIASMTEGRHFVGMELYQEWKTLAQKRVERAKNPHNVRVDIRHGDSLKLLSEITQETIDFIVTSPPYWGILDKKDHKAKNERIAKGLATHYGDQESDLSNISDYTKFLEELTRHFEQYHRVLKPKKYVAIIVSDFRHGQEYYMFHAHVADALKKVGFVIHGLITLVQDNKKLYPYGYPSAYVPNISNQFIIIGRKMGN